MAEPERYRLVQAPGIPSTPGVWYAQRSDFSCCADQGKGNPSFRNAVVNASQTRSLIRLGNPDVTWSRSSTASRHDISIRTAFTGGLTGVSRITVASIFPSFHASQSHRSDSIAKPCDRKRPLLVQSIHHGGPQVKQSHRVWEHGHGRHLVCLPSKFYPIQTGMPSSGRLP